jgi:hypothetical protein
MKKKIFFALPIIVGFIGFGSLQNAHSWGGGAPTGYTSSSSDNKTCGTNGGCHGGGSTAQKGWLTSTIPASGYVGGQTYSLTLTATGAQNKWGFSLMENSNLGTFTSTNETAVTGGYVTHKSTSTAGNGGKSWTFDWTAPAKGSGNVTFNASILGANGNSQPTGDNTYTASLSHSEDASSTVGISKIVTTNFSVFPNPTSDFININSDKNIKSINLFDLNGKRVISTSSITKIDVRHLDNGIYILSLDGKTQQITIQK